MIIGKTYRFEASHQLPWHLGKCAQLHGHSYQLEVEIEGDVRPDDSAADSGMVLDFAEFTPVKSLIESNLDHKHLNVIIHNPTAERIVEYIVSYLRLSSLSEQLYRVRLWETATCYAEWRR